MTRTPVITMVMPGGIDITKEMLQNTLQYIFVYTIRKQDSHSLIPNCSVFFHLFHLSKLILSHQYIRNI